MTIHAEQTVGEAAALSMAATRVFEDHGIDFCCGGKKPIAEACREKQVDPGVLIGEIEAAMQREAAAPETRNWNTEPLDALIEHILNRHHTYLREEFPRLTSWLAAVRRAHGARDGAMLVDLDAVFSALKDELETHMHKEETVLFPAIRRAESWIGQPVSMMHEEHESAGRALAELRRLTDGYRPPEHACATYRALYAGLEALERDLHMHIHLENNILFPRAMADTERGRGC
jgi:regulator of cell morphogenesis and NO signaling